MEAFGTFEFFAHRKKGLEPSQIPAAAADEVLNWVYSQADEFMFKVELKPDFKFSPVKGSFNKTLCTSCGEIVFERYARTKDGKTVCIPCSGY